VSRFQNDGAVVQPSQNAVEPADFSFGDRVQVVGLQGVQTVIDTAGSTRCERNSHPRRIGSFSPLSQNMGPERLRTVPEHGTFVDQEDHPQRFEVLVEVLDPSCPPHGDERLAVPDHPRRVVHGLKRAGVDLRPGLVPRVGSCAAISPNSQR
jgi:hypothetical protein